MKLGIESIVGWTRWPVAILTVGVLATAVSLAGPWFDDEFVEAGPAETVIAWFDTPGSGTTLHGYSDLVRIQVSGIGQAKGARYNDAF